MELLRVCVLFFLSLLACCGPITDLRERIVPDVIPPMLLGVRARSREEVELCFDEPPCCVADSIRIEPPVELLEAFAEDLCLVLRLGEPVPGCCYQLEATVEDQRGNGLHFLAEFYGFNDDLPRLVINEFTTRGTGNHPDAVEIKVLEEGNMGGIILYEGTPANFDDRLIFPTFQVAAEDFLIVHFKPQGILEEVDETEAKDLSGGLDSSDQAYDVWIPEAVGISGNNGVISLYNRPGGEIMDGVLYSNRTSESDERYRGFGTANSMERADELVRDGGWLIAAEQVRPEDAVNPEGSAGTRSICRDSLSSDTDTSADWHIVPTRGATFGSINSDECYLP